MLKLLISLLFLAGCTSTAPLVAPVAQYPVQEKQSLYDCVVEYSFQVSKRAEANYLTFSAFLDQAEVVIPLEHLESFHALRQASEEARGFDYRLEVIQSDHRRNQMRAGSELLKEIRRSEARDKKVEDAFLSLLKVVPQLSTVKSVSEQPWPPFTCGVVTR